MVIFQIFVVNNIESQYLFNIFDEIYEKYDA